MFAAGRHEMQQMDQYTMSTLGLPGVVLMENAGARVADEIISDFTCESPKIVVITGAGNNGGDGFVIARRLHDAGYGSLLCLMVDPERIKGDAKVHFDVYRNRNLPILYLQNESIQELHSILKDADVIVDALLGTGVEGPVREPLNHVISMMNEYGSGKPIISVDMCNGARFNRRGARVIEKSRLSRVGFIMRTVLIVQFKK